MRYSIKLECVLESKRTYKTHNELARRFDRAVWVVPFEGESVQIVRFDVVKNIEKSTTTPTKGGGDE